MTVLKRGVRWSSFDSFPMVIIKESKMLQSCRRQSSNANAIHWEVKKKYEKTAIVTVAYNAKQYLALQNQQKPENNR